MIFKDLCGCLQLPNNFGPCEKEIRIVHVFKHVYVLIEMVCLTKGHCHLKLARWETGNIDLSHDYDRKWITSGANIA